MVCFSISLKPPPLKEFIRLTILLSILFTGTTAHAEHEDDEDYSSTGQVCNDAAQIKGIERIRQQTKKAWDKQIEALTAIEAYRKACNAFMADPKQTPEAMAALNEARVKAQTEQDALRKAIKDNWAPLNQNIAAAAGQLGNEKCKTALSKNQDYFTSKLDSNIENGFKRACSIGAAHASGDDRRRAAASTIAKSDDTRGNRIAEILENPKSEANRAESKKMISEAAQFRKDHPELNLPDPQKTSRDYSCGERCAAIQRAMSLYDPAKGQFQSLEYWDAIEAAKATQLGIYGRVYK